MNTFDAGAISAIPVGGIVGGILCKSYGVLAVVGGVIAGVFAGCFAGWIYALLTIVLTCAFKGIWAGIKGLPELDINNNDHQKIISSCVGNSNGGVIYGVVIASIAGFLTNWWLGLIVAVIFAIMTSVVVVIVMHRGIRKIQAEKCK